MRERKYFIETFGCQMNEHDSEVIAGIMEGAGYSAATSIDEADIILFNTCCVRESAEQRILGRISRAGALKKRRPELVIGVGGCMVQYPEGRQRIKTRCPYVDFTFDTTALERLPEILAHHGIPVGCLVGEAIQPKRKSSLCAFVTITYGCDNFCSYCIVPYVRGPQKSRRPEEVIDEVRRLGERGYKEVTLLGQNVNAYGRDFNPTSAGKDWDFGDLLLELDKVPGIERIRYTTSHPRDFQERFIEITARSKKVCEHFHLPVQAGSNKVLRLMNRGYTKEGYLRLVEKIRELIPSASVTTDLIVGFPGEDDRDFEDTMDLVEKVRFDAAFTFMYSPRSGTAAATLPDQVALDVKKKRLERLIRVQNEIAKQINEAQKGKVLEVLVEGPSERDPKMLSGRTRTNKMVHFPGPENLTGHLVNVLITDAPGHTLRGEMTNRATI
ncbi:MAG TPA: tRNA (N6-isopentenyl adenosine(37)-C2)-methylthiotransferase MiaB [Clostridia bacterium]|nr:tRNA (N6-isopentenyl adenosine(37)-C2)-methylthiotransferase MiaB [Clostridia bacterium]